MEQHVRKRSQTKEIQPDLLTASILSKLQRAGIAGLTTTGLGLRSGTQRRKVGLQSLRDLASQREILGIGSKGRERWIHRDCLQEWLLSSSSGSLLEVYRELVSLDGIADITILQLAKNARLPLSEIKIQLAKLAEQGRVVLSRGDWSLASEEEREGAVEWFGQPHLRVRYV